MTTPRLIKSMGRSPSRLALLLTPLVFACFGLFPQIQAALPPEIPGNPDGCYPAFNTAEGCHALEDLGLGIGNTGLGWYALSFVVDGSLNTAVGAGALALNTANANTAVGSAALLLNETGTGNTAVGAGTLPLNDADGNTALGAGVLALNVIGRGNTAVGVAALALNDGVPNIENSGSGNTAVGARVLISNHDGYGNTAVGVDTLAANTGGSGNTAIGARALNKLSDPSSSANTAVGLNALTNTTEGSFSTAVGAGALEDNIDGRLNTAIGNSALGNNTAGGSNIAVGNTAGVDLTTGSNNIYIGNDGGAADESATIRIGTSQTATYIAGINEATASGGVEVFVNAGGQLGTLTSSARFKDEIKPMDKASKAILALKPVTFRYKKGIDPQRIPQFGLVAEEVEKVNPDLVVRDKEGKPYTVRYEAVNAMLLNEFLKEHKKVEKQEATITRLTNDFQTVSTQQRKEIQLLSAQLKEQATQIQKVSAQVEASKPAPQVVNNP